MIVFLFLTWSTILLVLVHFHVNKRDETLLSSWADVLDTLSTLLPAQSQQIADAILKATGVVATQQLAQSLSTVEQEVKDELKTLESEPYNPPWENLDPVAVDPRGQWGVDE